VICFFGLEIIQFFRQRAWRKEATRIATPSFWAGVVIWAIVATVILHRAGRYVPGAAMGSGALVFAVGMVLLLAGAGQPGQRWVPAALNIGSQPDARTATPVHAMRTTEMPTRRLSTAFGSDGHDANALPSRWATALDGARRSRGPLRPPVRRRRCVSPDGDVEALVGRFASVRWLSASIEPRVGAPQTGHMRLLPHLRCGAPHAAQVSKTARARYGAVAVMPLIRAAVLAGPSRKPRSHARVS
jgi:hypothetical protein